MQGAKASEEGILYCGNCYNDLYGKRCVKCGNFILGPYIVVDGKEIHSSCFVCSICSNEIEGSYFMKDEKPICRNCCN